MTISDLIRPTVLACNQDLILIGRRNILLRGWQPILIGKLSVMMWSMTTSKPIGTLLLVMPVGWRLILTLARLLPVKMVWELTMTILMLNTSQILSGTLRWLSQTYKIERQYRGGE